jgi:hypothetical protein
MDRGKFLAHPATAKEAGLAAVAVGAKVSGCPDLIPRVTKSGKAALHVMDVEKSIARVVLAREASIAAAVVAPGGWVAEHARKPASKLS